MKQNDKQRLFEVMTRLDKTFKPKLNEETFRDKNFKFHEGDEVTFLKDGKQIDGIISDYDYHMMTWKPTYNIDYMQDGRKMTIIGVSEDNITLKKSGSEEEYQKRFNQNKMIHKMQDGLEEEANNNQYFPITTPVSSEDDKLFTGLVNQGIDSHLEGFTKSTFDVKDSGLGKRRVFNFHTSELPILLRRLEELGTEEALQWKDDIENYDNNINEMNIGEMRDDEFKYFHQSEGTPITKHNVLDWLRDHPEDFDKYKHLLNPKSTDTMRRLLITHPQFVNKLNWYFNRLGSVDLNHMLNKRPELIDAVELPLEHLGRRDLFSILKNHPELNNHPKLQQIKQKYVI
jgi:hypothetical protein